MFHESEALPGKCYVKLLMYNIFVLITKNKIDSFIVKEEYYFYKLSKGVKMKQQSFKNYTIDYFKILISGWLGYFDAKKRNNKAKVGNHGNKHNKT